MRMGGGWRRGAATKTKTPQHNVGNDRQHDNSDTEVFSVENQ